MLAPHQTHEKFLGLMAGELLAGNFSLTNYQEFLPMTDIALGLRYAARVIFAIGRDYDYTPPPGGFVNNDETEYNAITWSDTESKPAWFYINDNTSQAAEWGAQQFVWENFPSVKTKVDGIAVGATKNLGYEGTASRADVMTVTKTATVSSGTAVFHFTDNGLSGGNALFPNGPILDSVNPTVSDASASYQYGWAWSNGNKTLTVTANKLTTANILTGILGQAPANGAVVKVTVSGS